MPTTQHTTTSKSKYMSEARRDKLLDIQRREQLKGMLVNKFKAKYGTKPGSSSVIGNEIDNFLKNEKLTEDNLKRLDERIQQFAEGGKQVPGDVKSVASSQKPKAPQYINDAASVRSYASSKMSGASNLSKGLKGKKNEDQDDLRSMYSDSQSTKSIPQLIDEEDEWAAIQKFNTVLHYEEQKQEMLREKERKKQIKHELDRQLQEKNKKKQVEKQIDDKYEDLQKKHLEMLERKEREKEQEIKEKIMSEKASRDRQLKEEKMRKKVEKKEQIIQETEQVERLREEMENEKMMYLQKRKQEYDYLQRMLNENEENKKKQVEEKHKEKLQDIKAQEEYTKVLEKEEEDRVAEFNAREKRAQEFMGRMANTVIKELDKKAQEEEEKIKKYELEKEMRERMGDEERMRTHKMSQQEMRVFLAKQLEEKKERDLYEKKVNEEQADMWAKDVKLHFEEEKKLSDKIRNINKDNANFLKMQMDEKKKGNKKMNTNEYLLNKKLLKGINEKKKDGGSEVNFGIQGTGLSSRPVTGA